MANAEIPDLDQLVEQGLVRLEMTAGIPTWEVFPGYRHQRMIDRIRATIEPVAQSETSCGCVHASDVLIRFRDGSQKRPDIAIFCTEPPDQDEALTLIPEAVVEVISPGYEYKDLSINPPFYLSQGVRDVVVVDPRAGAVTHHRTGQVANYRFPVTLELLCGCRCTIP